MNRFLSAISIFFLKAWHSISRPLFGDICRFSPSCSVYAMEAIRRHGVLAGWVLAMKRFFRCHPLNSGGPDPVPPLPGQPSTGPTETIEEKSGCEG